MDGTSSGGSARAGTVLTTIGACASATVDAQLVGDVARCANHATSVDQALREVIDRVCAATGWPAGHAYLLAGEGRRLDPVPIWHLEDAAIYATLAAATDAKPIPVGCDLAGTVAATAKPLCRYATCAGGFGMALASPILLGDEVVGVLEFFSHDVRPIAGDLLDAMVEVGIELGQVVGRARADRDRNTLDQTRSDFVMSAAHELRSHVAVVAQLGALLSSRHGDLSADQLRWTLDSLAAGSRWLSELTPQLLDLSAIDTGHAPVRLVHCDVGEIVRDTLAVLPPPAGSRITVDVPPGTVMTADVVRVKQILANLLQNAFKHGGSRIEISALRLRSAVDVSVADDGPGLGAAFAARAFEPFTREVPVDTNGAGLGLAIVRALARLQHGEVRYEPRLPVGARFVVRLPTPD